MPQDLGQLIDEITVDAYNLDEQLSGFRQSLPVVELLMSCRCWRAVRQ
jgi:hypothetical protein